MNMSSQEGVNVPSTEGGIHKHGKSVWQAWHWFAANLNVKDQNDVLAFKAYTVCMNQLLRCAKCRAHFAAMRQKPEYQIERNLGSQRDLFMMTYKMHNEVNSRLKKSVPSFEEMWNYYHDDKECDSCKLK
jgi:hypothetical protein